MFAGMESAAGINPTLQCHNQSRAKGTSLNSSPDVNLPQVQSQALCFKIVNEAQSSSLADVVLLLIERCYSNYQSFRVYGHF